MVYKTERRTVPFAYICALKEQSDYNTRETGDKHPKKVPIKAKIRENFLVLVFAASGSTLARSFSSYYTARGFFQPDDGDDSDVFDTPRHPFLTDNLFES